MINVEFLNLIFLHTVWLDYDNTSHLLLNSVIFDRFHQFGYA